MIVFDLINDEALLFYKAINVLIEDGQLSKDEVTGITEGNRWKNEITELLVENRLHYFDELDNENIDFKCQIRRISNEYKALNIYACDRYLTKLSNEIQEKLLVYTFLFYENLFKSGVTHYFTTGIAYTYNLVSYLVSQKYNVKHISFYGIRFENRSAVSFDTINTFNEVLDLFGSYQKRDINKDMFLPIEQFRNKPVQPVYMTNAINSFNIEPVFIKEFFVRFKRYYFSKKHKYDYFTRNPFELSRTKLSKIFNAKKINLFNQKIFDKVDSKDDFFLFPLHMQPEASTLILAPFYVNQLETIINISKVLPLGTLLYVKEHKSAFGQHKISFYKRLKQYPNIKLISYTENTFNLINKSKGIVSLSSTVGLESLILKKPVISLGDVFYNDSGLVFKASSYLQVEQYLSLFVNDNFSVEEYFEDYDEKIAYFIHCLKTKSYPFEFNVAKLDTKERVLQSENIYQFAKCILKQIKM